MNGIDGPLRDLLAAAVGEPPHRVSAEAVRRRVIRWRVVEFVAAAVAVTAIAVIIPVGIGALGRGPGRSTNVATPQSRPLRLDVYNSNPGAGAFWQNLGFAPYSRLMRRAPGH